MSERNDPAGSPQISRRAVLRAGALAGFGAFLAACAGVEPSPSGPAGSAPAGSVDIPTVPPATPSATAAPTPKVVSGPLKFANWAAYIDLTGKAADAEKYAPGSSPTIEDFKKKYNVDVDYEEKIEDNPSFLRTIQPAFVAGVATGWDLIVMTDSFAAQIISKGWAEKLDQDNLPNCTANLRDALKNQPWDPQNDYHYPWQSGMTGVGYNAKALKDNNIAAPTKIADLWNIPSNKVEFLTEARDTFGLTLLKLGIDPDPAKVTDDDLQKVHDDIKPLVDKGLKFMGQGYLESFGAKNVWAGYVWSGDLASSGGADDKFVFPEEGVMIWTDNMIIPKGATNKYTAELMMNWVYTPDIAAKIADYVYYVSPVKGITDLIKKLDPGAESNPLLFPTDAYVAKSHSFQFMSDELETKMNDLFADLRGT
jgi:spermidine/putrescine transport system substrate-binding protein